MGDKQQNVDKCEKTKSLLVTGKRIAKKLHDDITPCLNLKIKNYEIQYLEVSDLNLLGLTYDRNMTFTTLNVLPFTSQSQIKRNILVYKRVNTNVNTHNYIDRLLCRNSDIHERETRYSNADLMCPRFTRKTERGRIFTVRFSIEWNSTDMDIRKRVASFKYNLYKSNLDQQIIVGILDLFAIIFRKRFSVCKL